MEKNREKQAGSLGLENALYQTRGLTRYDEAGKKVLAYKEVLATILKYTIPEYRSYAVEDIMGFIDVDSISDQTPVAPDMDTRIQGDNTDAVSINEANVAFDIFFKVIEPIAKTVHLHVDVELQNNFYPGYPLEKRGIYNLARMISSQLDVITKKTNYDLLEKAYCIFICVGNVPKYLWNTVSYYEFSNTKNVGKVKNKSQNYDLMELVIIRIGEELDEGVSDIIHFLHGIFYETEEVEEFIDFSQNEEFRKELEYMALTGEHLIEYGMHKEQSKTLEALARLREAKKEREEAEKGKKEEERKREEAERAKKEEERKREEAEKAKKEEERKREEAEKAQMDAERAREEAEKAREDAERAKEDAVARVNDLEKRMKDMEEKFKQITQL